ncbi:BppU family phage baseplate upper protein [Enterococcus avium]|uniref:BppU family phage baseplate upper protein n=1 Tax=Enterococcus avium TaxID=33945 RepID=UPI0032E4FEB5
MANSKQAKFIVDVSAESKHTRKSSVRFFSYDSKTAEIVIQAEKDNELIPRGTISNVEIYFESVNSSYRPTESLKWNDQMTINDDGLFLYTLTDDLLNYQGLVAFEVYINYINNDKSDSSNRIIYEQRTSAIDRAADEIEIVYIKDMETAKKEVADKAAEVKESLAGYDSGLDIYADQKKTEMDDFTRNVQETAINEIAMIQNELPKVKQVNVDETKKIKAEYPIVEQVATTEKEKIRAVLSTVDQTASEVSAYADRKISEYDAKFTQSNQKMNDLQQSQTELSNQLDETKKKVDAADVYRKDEVFNKPESSANVIYQVIGKDEVEMTLTFDLKNKIASSDVENPNSASFRAGPTLSNPNQFTADAYINYLSLYSLDGTLLKASNRTQGNIAQVCIIVNILEELQRFLGQQFFIDRGAVTEEQKVAVLEMIVTEFTSNIYGFGVGTSGNLLTQKNWYGAWTEGETTTANTVTRIGRKLTNSDNNWSKYINGGKIPILITTGESDGITSSSINLDYANVEVKLKLSANEHIKLMIAAYWRPLEQQLNDLAQKVAAMENK